MARYVFDPAELPWLLRQHQRQFSSGYLRFDLRTQGQPMANETWLLAFRQGRLVYSGDQPLTIRSFAKVLGRFVPRLRLGWSRRAMRLIQERVVQNDSLTSLVTAMTELGLLKEGEVADALWLSLMTDFDRYLYQRGGTCRFEVHDSLAKTAPIAGFELDPCLKRAAERQDRWKALQPMINSMEAVPVLNWDRLEKCSLSEGKREKLRYIAKDGHSLQRIAIQLSRDPLEVAQLFADWAAKGLLTIQQARTLSETTPKPPLILAIDDSVVAQEMMRNALPTYRVLTTGHPSELLGLLYRHHPDLLLMDVTMPGLDGLELCRIIRGIEEFKSLPIVMMTARDGIIDRVKGKMSGASLYLTKPIDEIQLNQAVEKLLISSGIITDLNPRRITDPSLAVVPLVNS
ncbi:MAG: response regulator [Synechococcaceae cyanobacterium SM2_3_2]|nr:response regulator [Synechococcaceae cyanobacterium SM2_3_2]